MARPQKKGLDYFPLDVMMDRADDDIEMLEAKYGTNGFATLIKLYMKIYQDDGYYIKWNEKPSLLLAKRVNVDINLINSIINDLIEWGIFDKKLYGEYHILTSKRIQHTYIDAVKKRKSVEMVGSLVLVEIVNNNINLINSDIYPQSKVKKSKVDKSKEDKEDKEKPVIKKFIIPTVKELEEYCKERKNNVNPNKFFDFYESKGWLVGKNKMKNWKAAVRTWENNNNTSTNGNNKEESIYDYLPKGDN